MLVCILTIGLAILCLITGIVWLSQKDEDAMFAFVPGVALVLVSIMMIGAIKSVNSENEAHKIQQQVITLNQEYESLRGFNPDRERLQKYNSEAKSFNEERITAQERLKNPWVNLFYCYAWNEYDDESVKEITVYFITHL